MKNLKLTFAIVFVALFSLAGKTYAQSQTRFGIKAGLTYMTLGSATNNGISINYDYRPGFQGGLFTETPLSDAVVFTAQALYTQKGTNVNTTISGINITGHTTISYVDIPLMVGFKANPQLTFFVGPQASFLVSQDATLTANGMTDSSTETASLKSTLIGGNIGAGYALSENLGINLNYITDFSNSSKKAYDVGEKNSGFILTLGYKF